MGLAAGPPNVTRNTKACRRRISVLSVFLRSSFGTRRIDGIVQVIASAGGQGAVTISTNMAGRGGTGWPVYDWRKQA